MPSVDKDLDKILFNSSSDRFRFLKEKITSKSEPAIENGLLEILQLDVTKKEIDEYITKKEEN